MVDKTPRYAQLPRIQKLDLMKINKLIKKSKLCGQGVERVEVAGEVRRVNMI